MGVSSASSSVAAAAVVVVAEVVADADDFLRSLVFLLGACNGLHSSTLIIVGVSSSAAAASASAAAAAVASAVAVAVAVVWTTPDGKENVGITIHLFHSYVYTLSGGVYYG